MAEKVKTLAEMTRAELREFAKLEKLPGVNLNANRGELEREIRAALDAELEAKAASNSAEPNEKAGDAKPPVDGAEPAKTSDTDPAPAPNDAAPDETKDEDDTLPGGLIGKPIEKPPVRFVPPPTKVSGEQRLKIMRAHTDSLRAVLSPAEGEEPLPEYLAVEVREELARREVKAAQEAADAKLKGPVQVFKVTKGGRYVREGFVTRLEEGSILTPITHDLADVRAQGIEFCPSPGTEQTFDQLGNRRVQAL